MSYLDELFGLQGKVTVVTGAGRGIGQVVALGLAKAGSAIAIFSRTGADDTVKQIEAFGGKAKSYIVDVTDEAAVDRGLQEVLKDFGSLDVVFNNAGICYHEGTIEGPVEHFREVIDINLTGEYIVCRAAGRIMAERKTKGSIINMASMSGSIVNIPQWQAAYNASKAGVIHMTRSLAVEWSDYGIRVNSLSPGYIATPMSTDPDFVEPELLEAWLKLIPAKRLGKPEELIGPVVMLASDCSHYTSGADIIVDGAYACF